MSIEKAREFFNSIEAGGPVQEEYKGLLMECKGLSEKEAMDKVIRFASGKSFDINQEDMKSLSAEVKSRELSVEELNAVSAGGMSAGWVMVGADNAASNSYGSFCCIIGFSLYND